MASSFFKDLFSGHAADYAGYRPRYPAHLAAALAERAGGRALAVDCGCGSGQLSVVLAEQFERVVAVDASAAQIASALAHPRITYVVAPAERTGLPDRCADLVAAAQAAHWFDLPAFWAEVDRVARPGGLVVLVDYGLPRVAAGVDALVAEFHDATLGPYWPPERWIVLDGYAGIEFPYAELPAPELEMTAAWSLHQFVRYLSTWSAVKAMERATGRSPLPELAGRLSALWGDAEAVCTVRWPLRLRLGTVGERVP